MKVPPFPDVPIAPIDAASYNTLEVDAAKIFTACKTDGFFYLDLTGHPILDQAEKLHDLAVEAFETPIEEKMKHLIEPRNLSGYKAAGTKKQTDSALRRDTTEMFNIYTDHAHGFTDSRSYPPVLTDAGNWTLIKQFTHNGHALGNEILSLLAKQLDIGSEEFASRNVFGVPSGSHCRLTHKFPREGENFVGLPSHTDFGSITILFNWLGGLQIEHRGDWKYVKPLQNHAIINLGDATRRFTNGALLSAKHRVIPPPAEQATMDRYSVVYFIRPGDDVMMEPLERFRSEDGTWERVAGKFEEPGGRVMSAGEWMVERQKQMIGSKFD